MTKIDLNAPAFGTGAQKVTDAEAAVITEDVKPVVVNTEVEPSVEEANVPYKRFKKFHDAAKEAREEADYWRGIAEKSRQEVPRQQAPIGDDMPTQWAKLYGDDERSKNAWEMQKQINADIREQARQDALDAVRNERYEENSRTESNMEQLDDNFEDLSALVGRNLTDNEQEAILDIVDDYTPKDRDGNYAGEILSFDKAWEIYELKNQTAKAGTINTRNNIAALSGNHTQGEPGELAEKNKTFNPFDWDAYKRRI